MSTDLTKLQRSSRDLARWQKAQQQLVGERYGPALASYRELVQRFPGVSQLWFELGLAATGDLEFGFAQQAFARACHLGSNDAALQVLLGQQFHRLRKPEQARGCFERAVQADPGSVDARLSLAAWYERERRLGDASLSVETCLAKHAQNAQALCLKALFLHRNNQNAQAETVLCDLIKRDPPDPNVRISSRHLLGVILDQTGRYEEALKWLVESKDLVRRTANVAKMEQDYDQADSHRRQLLSALTPQAIRRWREETQVLPLPNPLVLLGGHPRSGTTLLEQILGAHPSVVAFDESEAFVREVWHKLAPMQSAKALTFSDLDNLPPESRECLRGRYLKSLLRELDTQPVGLTLLDKNPSPTAGLHLWLRVLPETKVIIALRDPRDVVISCFFQNLMLTPTNANFLSLQRTTKHYADLMDVWLRLRELGEFDWIESRYEDVVENTELEGRKVTEFCGLKWDAAQGAFQEKARKKVLFAPTFSDVAQPVHKRAVGRWEHYAAALEPVMPRLTPYCKQLGYPA